MSTIQPNQILQIMDLTAAIRKNGGKYIPCFVGDPGIGKSEIVQQWAKTNGYRMIDLRLAVLEAPDMVGMPVSVLIDGQQITVHSLPDFLPKASEGKVVLFLDELNRANESTRNAVMQLLTDRKMLKYVLPEEVLIVSAINPNSNGDVDNLGPALQNRLSFYDVVFHHNSFLEYMKKAEYNPQLIAFAESGLWQYKTIAEVGDTGHYIGSRSFSKTNDIMKVINVHSPLFFEAAASNFGKVVASDFVKFLSEIRPVLWEDFQKDEKGALSRFKKMTASSGDYVGDLTAATVTSIADAYNFDKKNADGTLVAFDKPTDEFLLKLVKYLDADKVTDLLCRTIALKERAVFDAFMKKNKKIFDDVVRRKEGKEVA